jgi:hypothetical protein
VQGVPGGSAALVVVGHHAQATRMDRQAGQGPIERLDLALLVEVEGQGAPQGGWRYIPITSWGSRLSLNVLIPWA